MSRPVTLGITIGDVGGIGPEVAVKAALGHPWPNSLRLVLVGSPRVLAEECAAHGLPAPPVVPSPEDATAAVSVWEPLPAPTLRRRLGRSWPDAARWAGEWVKAAVAACRRGTFQGLVTAPISKEGFQAAGIRFPGHTELLADLTGTPRFAMLLLGGPLRVVLVTRHIPLSAVPEAITAPRIVEAAELVWEALPWLGAENRTLAVCALNPHGGEGGLLGREEAQHIEPALRTLRKEGVAVEGPVPADVVFHRARQGRYGAVVAMYHDQGLGPLKTVAFESGINVTLGLPLVRTSPDHGTAFDIAGRGVANPQSMIEAVRLAAELAVRPNPWKRAF
jgi:4-hydroxythreonine-4-phosphate dehydrogenase